MLPVNFFLVLLLITFLVEGSNSRLLLKLAWKNLWKNSRKDPTQVKNAATVKPQFKPFNESCFIVDKPPLLTDKNGCIIINKTDINEAHFQGTALFNESCENTDCVEISGWKQWTRPEKGISQCLRKTGLRCDLDTHRCICSGETDKSPIHFQWHDLHQYCYIRPTFDCLPGILCSPEASCRKIRSKYQICACENGSGLRIDTSDENYWKCPTS